MKNCLLGIVFPMINIPGAIVVKENEKLTQMSLSLVKNVKNYANIFMV